MRSYLGPLPAIRDWQVLVGAVIAGNSGPVFVAGSSSVYRGLMSSPRFPGAAAGKRGHGRPPPVFRVSCAQSDFFFDPKSDSAPDNFPTMPIDEEIVFGIEGLQSIEGCLPRPKRSRTETEADSRHHANGCCELINLNAVSAEIAEGSYSVGMDGMGHVKEALPVNPANKAVYASPQITITSDPYDKVYQATESPALASTAEGASATPIVLNSPFSPVDESIASFYAELAKPADASATLVLAHAASPVASPLCTPVDECPVDFHLARAEYCEVASSDSSQAHRESSGGAAGYASSDRQGPAPQLYRLCEVLSSSGDFPVGETCSRPVYASDTGHLVPLAAHVAKHPEIGPKSGEDALKTLYEQLTYPI